MAKIETTQAYFQAVCFPQKFVGVHVGLGYSARLEPGERVADIKAKLYNKARREVEAELQAILTGATTMPPEKP